MGPLSDAAEPNDRVNGKAPQGLDLVVIAGPWGDLQMISGRSSRFTFLEDTSLSVRAEPKNERQYLQRKIQQVRDLLREYPDDPINQTMRDYIAELEQQLRDLDNLEK